MTSGVFKVESLGSQGDGIVRIGEKAEHVARVLPGELVKLGGEGRAQIVETSADRVEPFCKYFDQCGGCKFQHWRAEPYQAWKRQRVVDELARQGIDAHVEPLIDAHGAGRRRVTLHARHIDGVWRAGFMQAKSHHLMPLEWCPVLVPDLSDACAIAAEVGACLGDADVAITSAVNGLDVSVKAGRNAVLQGQAKLLKLFQVRQLCRLMVNGETLAARETPFTGIGDLQVPLPPLAFLQATQTGEDVLAAHVLRFLAKSKHVADLFSGHGTFALRLAAKAKVFAVDSEKNAIDCLMHAARHAKGLKPIGSAVRNLFANPLTRHELAEFDAVVLDPPRAGAENQVQQLAKSNVKQVAYVSCDAQSFARDAKALVNGEYKISNIFPVDQFKWSQHVEIVSLFEKVKRH